MPTRGRPSSSRPKKFYLQVRMDSQTLQTLDRCASELGISKSAATRLAIETLKDALTPKKDGEK